ncbi:MAG TPA: response regulator transcription factor [Candidatus Binatia bacterium]|jgi:DNA-binding NarL/FixJ family response regulator|nr:response regulator transcription factor [Candidatus Binatia bacterium]
MAPIKVVIADDHALFRDGLRKILSLEKDILVVGEAANSEEVPKVVERTKPDILLLDLKMPKGDMVQNLLDVAARNSATRVMILTAFSDDENVLNAAKGGAKGYVPKGVPSTVLLQAIKTVHSGGSWIDKEISSWETFEEILQGHSDPRDGAPKLDESIKTLTKREMEILRLVAEGLTNEEIGKKIFISEKTVKTHLTNIFDKLKVNNRFKAALMLMGHPR